MKIYLHKLHLWKKRSIAFLADVSVIILAWIASIVLSAPLLFANVNITVIGLIAATQSATNIYCGLYRGVWRFASIPDLIRIIKAAFIGTVLNIIILNIFNPAITYNIYIIYLFLLIIFLSGTRLLFRYLRDYRHIIADGKRILVVGAGDAGASLMRDLYRSSLAYEYLPIAFVDDDLTKQGCDVHGVRILGSCKNIPEIVHRHNIELILIAIPSATSKRMREIVSYCEQSGVSFRTLPSLKNLTDGVVGINTLREILLEDLLGREQVIYDWDVIKANMKHKTILVTGGGGSIGSELCRQIFSLCPDSLVIVDNSEFNLYSINMEMAKSSCHTRVISRIASVTDKIEMNRIFTDCQPDIVFHVAAYKHVPLLESHIRVSIHNNIIGTKIIADLADEYKVASFVLISTDKAVNPTSVMGATKRGSEMYCQTMNSFSRTRFITVRFGNVLDSAGSVIPLFRQQIVKGGPVTVTHPDISRYFMTIPEAAQLILQATYVDTQAEIFVLDMGEPINIRYLAEQMIKLSGKVLGQDIDIEYTGLRPGEKLYEELFHENECIFETTHPKIKQAKVRLYDFEKIKSIIRKIETAYQQNNEADLINLLHILVEDYKDSSVEPQNIYPICTESNQPQSISVTTS